jgi:hypothetical protein
MIAPPRRRLAAVLAVAVVGLAVMVVVLLRGGGGSPCSAAALSTGCATAGSGPSAASTVRLGPNGMPLALPAAGSNTCSQTVNSAQDAAASIGSAKSGAVICLKAGLYNGLTLSGDHAGAVTIQPVPGEQVTLDAGARDSRGQSVAVYVAPGARNLIIHGFRVRGEVELSMGDSSIRLDHNDITGGPYGIELSSEDCHVANAPRWSGCGATPKITDVTVSGNRIHDIGGPTGSDAINANNYANLRVTGNDVYGMHEGGNHTDCFQSTFGGSGLLFDHNYEHDDNCQGFFTKDGDVTDAVLYDNLFLRDQVEHEPEGNLDIINVYRLTIRRNTSLPDTVDAIRDQGSAQPPHAAVDHNVFEIFANGCCDDPAQFHLNERYNIFAQQPDSFRIDGTDRVARAQFVDPRRDDYRLVHNPHGIGIDWSPADQHYGP